MNCHVSEQQIGDYVDGTIDAGARTALERHLAGCARCRAIAVDFAAIQSLSRTLEPHAPPAHVWAHLSAATAPPPARSLRLPMLHWQALAAAAMVVLLAGSLAWVGARLSDVGTAARPQSAALADDIALAAEAAQQAEAEYVTAIATLEQVTSADRDIIDPETDDVLQAGMAVIDDAIAESRAVLASNPENELAQDSLFEALRRKVALLQYVFALINEMRKGNEEGAARVLSELNR